MTGQGIAQVVLFVALLTALTPLVGAYMARVFTGQRVWLTPLIDPVERVAMRMAGRGASRDQDWKQYAISVLVFSVVLVAAALSGARHPGNPPVESPRPRSHALGRELQHDEFLRLQHELAVLRGRDVALVLQPDDRTHGPELRFGRGRNQCRGRPDPRHRQPYRRHARKFLAGPHPDHRLCAASPLDTPHDLLHQPGRHPEPLLVCRADHADRRPADRSRMGPNASQEAIKLLGTNGGGFFNVNSAMPFSNPSGLTNFVQVLSILLIPAALTATFGRMVGNRRQGWAIYIAMMVLFLVAVAIVYVAESTAPPAQHPAGITGGNMEGKEITFRHRRIIALRRGDHGRLLRCGQCRDGIPHRPRRCGSDVQHHDRGSDLRRGRGRSLRNAPDGADGGLPRRA